MFFKERIDRALKNNEKISLNIAIGFFFFEGFQKFCLNLLNISIEEKGKYMGFKIKEVLEIKRNQQAINL
jgi:hypothetical protein